MRIHSPASDLHRQWTPDLQTWPWKQLPVFVALALANVVALTYMALAAALASSSRLTYRLQAWPWQQLAPMVALTYRPGPGSGNSYL